MSETFTSSLTKGAWYYRIELTPGEFTPGAERGTLRLTRPLLQGIDVEGMRCADIGTMEGVLPTLIARRGAVGVVATDLLDLTPSVSAVAAAYGVSFEYSPLTTLPEFVAAEGRNAYDVVSYCGAWYHSIDPMSDLLRVRSLVRDGGLLLFESATLARADHVIELNSAGRFYPRTNYLLSSVGALGYFLRFCGFEVLDVAHNRAEGRDIARVAVVARAVPLPLPLPDDPWMTLPDLDEHLGRLRLTRQGDGGGAEPVGYRSQRNHLLVHFSDSNLVDLATTVLTHRLRPAPGGLSSLRLADTY